MLNNFSDEKTFSLPLVEKTPKQAVFQNRKSNTDPAKLKLKILATPKDLTIK